MILLTNERFNQMCHTIERLLDSFHGLLGSVPWCIRAENLSGSFGRRNVHVAIAPEDRKYRDELGLILFID